MPRRSRPAHADDTPFQEKILDILEPFVRQHAKEESPQ